VKGEDRLTKKIGIMVGRENTWPDAFIEEVNRRNAGVTAEFVQLDGTGMAEDCPYDLIVDRISHEVPYYRTFLRTAMLSGTVIVNNPFWWSASDDKLFGATICSHIGVAHPRTIALPSHSYIEGIDHHESLRNLRDSIPWAQHVEHVGGFPVILKPNSGGGFKQVFKVNNLEQLWEAYNQTGTECMILQEFIGWEKYVRCLVIGQEQVLVMKFDVNEPYPHRYFDEPGYITPEEHAQVVESALKIVRAFGYDMNTCEFALKNGVPYEKWRALRDRFHQPRAGYGLLVAERKVLRLGCQCHGRYVYRQGAGRPLSVRRADAECDCWPEFFLTR
jgi:hypothetical protein